MATLRRGLVDKVKKAAAKVGTRGVQAAAKVGTRGARALVETTAAAVKTVDKIKTLGRRSNKAAATEQTAAPMSRAASTEAPAQKSAPRASTPMTAKTGTPRRSSAKPTTEAQPVATREAGRKTMPAAAAKRSKQAKAPQQFKAKRGQKHLHTGR